ncbi:uncharacterized protein [Drosophila pseudoobscura]|uniref:Uncharacterized protein n=1 Tax=Drosophila pseudoobscura pseudoobscura TaxID=46245 RepID=A0A6I8WA65_DROPS|nr:uncharacterized protein LOC117185006 [Drosophila pseudoobscura]
MTNVRSRGLSLLFLIALFWTREISLSPLIITLWQLGSNRLALSLGSQERNGLVTLALYTWSPGVVQLEASTLGTPTAVDAFSNLEAIPVTSVFEQSTTDNEYSTTGNEYSKTASESSPTSIEYSTTDNRQSTTNIVYEQSTARTTEALQPETKRIKFFVNTPQCQMPYLNPFSTNILNIYQRKRYVVCDKDPDMLKVIYNEKDQTYKLHRSDTNSTCCYKQILRAGVRTTADSKYKLLSCVTFPQDFVVPPDVEAVITECRRHNSSKVLQKDGFSFVHPQKPDPIPSSSPEERPSVLLWGIDSLSRMNFELTMPLTYKYFRAQPWYELQGYNKMGDNTFPNLMAILTGFNQTRSYSKCRPTAVGGLDACPMIWKRFKAEGYATAYAEDWASISTFDYLKKGFRTRPTDVYGRPLVLALEKELQKKYIKDIPYCLGRKSSAEYIYDLAEQFTEVHKNRSFFGMFWTNSFSHNDFSLPSAMDARMVKYMRTLDHNGIMQNTIIIFFSDHGTRFGLLRKLDSGFLEERLPVIYIRLPKWIRDKYPEFLDNLKANKNRLTSPYDIHATLKHILELDTPAEQLPRPEGCPTCHSVFQAVSLSRNCSLAGIDDHWCSCGGFTEVSSTDQMAKTIAEQLVEAINQFLISLKGTQKCRHLKLDKIMSVHRKGNSSVYLIQLSISPGGGFLEASAEWNPKTQKISTSVPSISRLDSYGTQSRCVQVKEAKKFCVC